MGTKLFLKNLGLERIPPHMRDQLDDIEVPGRVVSCVLGSVRSNGIHDGLLQVAGNTMLAEIGMGDVRAL